MRGPWCVHLCAGAMLQGDAALACSTDTSGFCFSINETAACRYDFVPRGETCWPALHYCDLDATCSGSSGECPSENPENPACPVTCPKEGLPDCVDAESGGCAVLWSQSSRQGHSLLVPDTCFAPALTGCCMLLSRPPQAAAGVQHKLDHVVHGRI